MTFETWKSSLLSDTWSGPGDGRADSLQTSSLDLDILRDLKRINAHIVSVAHPIMDEQGLLGGSRLIVKVSSD